MGSEKAAEPPEPVLPSESTGLRPGTVGHVREFRGLEASFAGRVLWLGAVGVLFGVVFALLSLVLGSAVARVSPDLFVYWAFPDSPFAGASYWGLPFPFLRIACRGHSDGSWEWVWSLLLLDALIWALPVSPVAAVFLTRKVRKMKRWRRGVCLQCEYDLRGLTEPRCPECGTPFEHVFVGGNCGTDTTI